MSHLFNQLPDTKIDPIMQAIAAWPAFSAQHPGAVNTTVGVLIDPNTDKPWQPTAVIRARESALKAIEDAHEFGYQGQVGNVTFLGETAKIVFGTSHTSGNVLAYQTLGGTSALYLAKELLAALMVPATGQKIPLVLDAGWPNHPAIFSDSFEITDYEHLDESRAYNHEAAMRAVRGAPQGSVLLLQTCGYNDDGADRSPQQWDEILDVAPEKEAVVLLDSAYLGLAEGFAMDRYPIEQSVKKGLFTLVSHSTSKNMGLYNERVGALFIANASERLGAKQAKNLHQVVTRIIRRTISNPPLLAAKAAGMALQDPQYFEELENARQFLKANRQALAGSLGSLFPTIATGKGLFTKLLPNGFTESQLAYLDERGILALPNSRINLGGMRFDQIERVGSAIAVALEK